MKNQTVLILMTFIFAIVGCQKTVPGPKEVVSKETTEIAAKVCGSVKARHYGADAYGMKKYIMAFLKSWPNHSVDSVQRSDLQRAHLDNINRLANKGKLVLDGPFFGNDDLRRIYVLNVQSIEEARLLSNTDPSIKAGDLEIELREWYASAALMEVNELHATFVKEDI